MTKVHSQFKASAFYQGYAKGLDMRYFFTGSQAEFHDPYLRRVLAKYVLVLLGEEAGCKILEDDAAFHESVIAFKNVVTHFFAYKQECWLNTMLRNIFGLAAYFGVFEFAKGRGAIHTHGCGFSDTEIDQFIDELLARYGVGVHEAVTFIEDFILKHYDPASGDTDPLGILYPRKKAMDARREFLSKSGEEGQDILNQYDAKMEHLQTEIPQEIGTLMEFHFGVSAMHIGRAPTEWVKPGGRKDHDYRRTHPEMMSKDDVWEQKPLRKFKSTQENDLYCRRVQITNCCYSHKCSGYCWVPETRVCRYNKEEHGIMASNPNIESIFKNDDGDEMMKLLLYRCRMGFGYKLRFPLCGDSTGGMDRVRVPGITFDKNGQPKLLAVRNHPRIVQEPVTTLHFGANADIQRFLTNGRSYKLVRCCQVLFTMKTSGVLHFKLFLISARLLKNWA
jgi:hypothetical protein